MKINDLGSKILVAIIAGVFTFLIDEYFALWVYRNYEVVVKGILGVTLLVMLYRAIFIRGSTRNPFQISSNADGIKFILFCIFWAIAGYWALKEVSDMIFYLVKIFRAN